MSDLKILHIDIETFPAIVYTYDLFQPIISHKQIIEPSKIMCFAAKWDDKKTIEFYAEWDGQDAMLTALHGLIDEADVIVGYNSRRFDYPWITGELMAHKFQKPSPVKHIDLFQVIRSNTRWLSKKLDYVSERLLDDRKVDVNTMQLGIQCYSDDEKVREKARRLMKRYNRQDVALLPRLVDDLRSFIKWPHPVRPDSPYSCHSCGSHDLQKRGTAKTLTGEYQRFQCNSCGSWFRDTHRHSVSDIRAL